MNRSIYFPIWIRSISLTALVLGVFLGGTQVAEAGLTLSSSSGSVTYAVYNTAAGSGFGSFSNGGNVGNGGPPANALIYPGGGLPALTTQVPNTSQTDIALSLSPSFTSTANSTPNSFGSATTQVYVSTSGQQGSFTTQGGVYWSLRTKLADNLPSGSSLASVSFSTAVATYTNLTGGAITINPGAVLSIAGTLGDSNSYIAAGLSTSISIYDGEVNTTTALDPIILASGGGVNIASKGNNPNEFASVTVNGSKVSGTGTSYSNSIVIQPFQVVTITSYLTLISDPGSTIGITNDIPAGLTVLPDFGTFASSPDPAVLVPEPSTFVLLGSGLAIAGFWNRSKRRHPSTKV